MSFPFKKSIKNLLDWIVDKLLPAGQRGQIPMLKNDTEVDRENSWIVIDGNFVTSVEERDAAMNNRPSNEEVFNSWGRFWTHPSANYSAETQAWRYNAATDQVVCTLNTGSYVGFYSRAKYDNYFLEARLSSAGADDDLIGVVIAYAVDADGNIHTLSAVRSNGGVASRWEIYCDYFSKIAGSGWAVAQKNSSVTAYVNGTASGWSAAGVGCKVRIRRIGDNIEAWTTQMGNTTDFPEELKLTVNLSSDPRLSIFRGPKAYGYSAYSQELATFSDIKFLPQGDSILHNYIFDLTENRVFEPKENGTFEEVFGYDVLDTIGPGKYIRDRTSSKMWFITGEMNLLPLGRNMGKAGGDLYKDYPNPMVKKIQGNEVAEGVPARKGDVLRWETDGPTPKWVPERVSHIQGHKVKLATPIDKQILQYSGSNNQWEPVSANFSSGAPLAILNCLPPSSYTGLPHRVRIVHITTGYSIYILGWGSPGGTASLGPFSSPQEVNVYPSHAFYDYWVVLSADSSFSAVCEVQQSAASVYVSAIGGPSGTGGNPSSYIPNYITSAENITDASLLDRGTSITSVWGFSTARIATSAVGNTFMLVPILDRSIPVSGKNIGVYLGRYGWGYITGSTSGMHLTFRAVG